MLFCCFLGGCGSSGPPTRGNPVTFEAVCDKANDGKRILLEGYLDFPESFKYRGTDDTVMLRLKPAPDSKAAVVAASAKIGNGANHVEAPPKSFRREDLKLHTSDGQVAGYGQKVKVSGTMYYPSSMATVEFKCGLTNSLFESAGQ